MASASVTVSPAPESADCEVSLARLFVLRATYLLLVVGLGAMVVPVLVSHDPMARGVIPSLLGAVWILSFVGLRYPLQMLPLLMFEFLWKLVWMVAFGFQQWWGGQTPPTFAEDSYNIAFGLLVMPIVIPWGYVWRHYAKVQGDRWR